MIKFLFKIVAIVVLLLFLALLVRLDVIPADRWAQRARGMVYRARAVVQQPAARGNSPACAEACRQNLRAIEAAKARLRAHGPSAVGTPQWGDIERVMGHRPSCPCGGAYSLGSFEQLPACSIGAGGTADPADDHRLRRGA